MFCQVLFLFLTLKNQNKGDFRTLVLLFQLICPLFAYILVIKGFYLEYIMYILIKHKIEYRGF